MRYNLKSNNSSHVNRITNNQQINIWDFSRPRSARRSMDQGRKVLAKWKDSW